MSPGACWVQDKFVPTLLAGYAIWVPFNLLSFRLIPQVRVVDDSRGGGQHSGTSAGAGATPVLDPSLCLLASTPPPLAQDLRILAGNTVGIAWGAFLSLSCVNAASGL